MLRDVNGDSVADVIGRLSRKHKSTVIAAFDGKSGDRLWVTESIGPREGGYGTAIGLTDELLVVSNKAGEVFAFELASGAKRWQGRFGERVKTFCRGAGDGTVIAVLADKSWHAVKEADGSVSEASPTGACKRLPHDDGDEDRPGHIIIDNHVSSGEAAPDGNEFEGIYIDEAIIGPSGIRIGLGAKSPGTRTPMLARYEPKKIPADVPDPGELQAKARSLKGRERRDMMSRARDAERIIDKIKPTLLWKAVIPAIDPLKVSEGDPDPEEVAVSPTHVAAVYGVPGGGHKYRLACLDVATGANLWDISLSGTWPLAGVTISSTAVVVARWTGVESFDIASGKKLWSSH